MVATGLGFASRQAAEFGEKMPPIVAIAAIGRIIGFELVEMAIDRGRHLILDNRLQRLPAKPTISLAQSRPSACIAFTTSNAIAKLVIVAACCDMGVLLCVPGSSQLEYPFLALTQNPLRHRGGPMLDTSATVIT